MVNLQFSGVNGPVQVIAVNSLGRAAAQYTFRPPYLPEQSIDIGDLPKGVYFIRVRAAGWSVTERMVLQ